MIHTHLTSRNGTIDQLGTDVPIRLNFTTPHKIKRKLKNKT